MQIGIARVERVTFSTGCANKQMPRWSHLFDDPKLINDVIVRFALRGRRHLVSPLARRPPMFAEPIDDPIARLPISLKKHFSPASNTQRIGPQVVLVNLAAATGKI